MGALMIFTVTPDVGEPLEVPAGSRDLARWEKLGRMPNGQPRTLATWQQNPSMEEMYRVCWIAMERLSRAGALQLPEGVTDWEALGELCDIVSKPAEGMEGLAAAGAAQAAAQWGGGAYPPGR